MRILLTGASGQVGGALRPIIAASHEVVAPIRSELDLSYPEGLPAALDRIGPSLIINPAAYTAVDRAEDEPDFAFRVNAEAPGVMARWAADRGIPFVHFSTDYVFDGSGERPWSEEAATNPLSVYGGSKLAGENAIMAARGDHLIVRTSWVYAARGGNFLRTIARLAKEREELRIVADQVGAPTSARTIADAVAQLLKTSNSKLPELFAQAAGTVHIAALGESSWHGFAEAIVSGLRARGVDLAVKTISPIKTEDFPTKASRPRNSRLDLTRLQEVFGVTPQSWREALNFELDALAREMSVAELHS